MVFVMTSPTSPTRSRKKTTIVVTEPPKFDLDIYIANYTGRTRYDRLIHIGQTSTFLGVDAFKAAILEAKAGRDVKRYQEAVTRLESISPRDAEVLNDTLWVSKMQQANQAETNRLEAQLKGYKNNLIKESIRMGNEDIGNHYQSIGNLTGAYEAYGRMRQDVMIPKHIVEISKHIIELAVEEKQWHLVNANVHKIKAVQLSSESDKMLRPYLEAIEGLTYMDSRHYYKAALHFLNTDAGMGSNCNNIVTSNDIAVYGGICALATMHRVEMRTRVLENASFRTYLELEPHIRRAITFFVNGRYSACLGILESYRTNYLLDLHLHKHFEGLYRMIRSKCIQQYFLPFSCVKLKTLNEAFAAPRKTIDKEIIQMIQLGELRARIDTPNRLLTALSKATRFTLYREAISTAQEYEREARRRILHMNIVAADLEVKGVARRGGGGSAMGSSNLSSGRMAIDDMYDFQSMGAASGALASAAGLLGGRSRDDGSSNW